MQFRQVMRNTKSARAGCWFNNAFGGAGRKIRMRNYFLSASQELVRLTDVRVGLPSSLTRHVGDAMRASQKSRRKKAKANRPLAYVSSTLSLATHNLINMVATTAVAGAVLLALLKSAESAT